MMENLLHKMCERAEAELWELVREEEWCPAHAEAAYYFVEIVKAIKKIEHLENLEETMEKYKWEAEEEEESDGKQRKWAKKNWMDEVPEWGRSNFSYYNNAREHAHVAENEWKVKYEEEKKKNEELMRRLPPQPPVK